MLLFFLSIFNAGLVQTSFENIEKPYRPHTIVYLHYSEALCLSVFRSLLLWISNAWRERNAPHLVSPLCWFHCVSSLPACSFSFIHL